MTKAFSEGVDCSPCLSDGVAIDTDQFSILDGLGERSSSAECATSWLRAVRLGVAGLALALGAGAVLMHDVDRAAANVPIAAGLSAKTAGAALLGKVPAIAGASGAQIPAHGGAARIVSAEPGQGWAAVDGPAGGRALSPGADSVRLPSAPASVPPIVLSQALQATKVNLQQIGPKAARPGRPAGAVPHKKRDRDVDIIAAIVENAGRR